MLTKPEKHDSSNGPMVKALDFESSDSRFDPWLELAFLKICRHTQSLIAVQHPSPANH